MAFRDRSDPNSGNPLHWCSRGTWRRLLWAAAQSAARLLAAAYGDQTLLSRGTQELVWICLPPGVSLLDLGEHRLKDLFRPERVFQVCASDLPSAFPPLKTLDAMINPPAQPTTFVGRKRELAAVLALLRRDDVRLITLTGSGGTGKTRLCIQAAANSCWTSTSMGCSLCLWQQSPIPIWLFPQLVRSSTLRSWGAAHRRAAEILSCSKAPPVGAG